jgi:hypothetical protein
MLRPATYQQAQVATHDIPYRAVEGSSNASVLDGMLSAGQIVWTQEPDPAHAKVERTTAFLDGTGLVTLDAQMLIPADVMNGREHKQTKSNEELLSSSHEVLPSTAPAKEPLVYHPTHEEIEKLAYSIWEKRARSEGSAEDDWSKAEGELRALGPDVLLEAGIPYEPH